MPGDYKIHAASRSDYIEIIDVWEASVRATHDFLTENDIQYFKPLILNQYLDLVELDLVKDDSGKVMGFLGTAAEKIEMLFLHPDLMGKGIGRLLLNHAINEKHAMKLDVNEQNQRAVSFYLRAGFEIVHRSPLDSLGKPFPILAMELKK